MPFFLRSLLLQTDLIRINIATQAVLALRRVARVANIFGLKMTDRVFERQLGLVFFGARGSRDYFGRQLLLQERQVFWEGADRFALEVFDFLEVG